MNDISSALAAWRRFSGMAGGKLMFSHFLSWKALYFASISARFNELRPGYCDRAQRTNT